jgi:hypothetical protein
MITYLIKVTIIWAIFLCLYEWLFKRNASFTLNRIYLFGALTSGLIMPLIAWNTALFKNGLSGVNAINNGIQNFAPTATSTAQQVGDMEQAVDWYGVIKWLYIAGVVLFAVISFREVVLILRTAIYGRFTTVQGHKIFSSEKKHAPFSFMGWVFISNPEQYSEEELHYIVKHEDGHNNRKHWLDMILIQIILIIFWFHPLVWYFRYLLKLTHEYDADKIAADDNVYDYGHFLLGQVLLKGTPSIAHSFHFSPIKNRITMLTNTKKKNNWKYLFAIPVLLTCTFVFARSNPSGQRVRVGDVTTYNGHRFYWQRDMVDSTQVIDPTTGETTWAIGHRKGSIYRMDNDSVYSNGDMMITQAQFRYNSQQFYEYLESKFKSIHTNIPDSITAISISDIVIDGNGKVSYYDLQCRTDRNIYDLSAADSPFPYGKTIDKIINESPDWLPAIYKGKNIKVLFGGFGIYYKQ